MTQRTWLLLALLAAPFAGASLMTAAPVIAQDSGATAGAAATTQTTSKNLRIVVTAVQGQAEVKFDASSPWQKVVKGMELPVGCQIRTGIPGSVQFMVGDDEVYRVDRLSLVQVVLADESEQKIKTVVGMTYGRVSKDVDAPVEPHDDTIVSPGSTLATRGTRVSLYDQPPYAPEAVSLTGAAVFRNLHGLLVQLGAKNAGTAKVDGNSTSPAQFQASSTFVDPQGSFAGRTQPEFQAAVNMSGLPPPIAPNVILAPADMQGVMNLFANAMGGGNMNGSGGRNNGGGGSFDTTAGVLMFPLTWTGPANTVVDFSVQSPAGNTVSAVHPMTHNGGMFLTGPQFSDTANAMGLGSQEIDWGNLTSGTFPDGTYTITETLEGTSIDHVLVHHDVTISTSLAANQMTEANNGSHPGTIFQTQTNPAKAELNNLTPTATFTVTAPMNSSTMIERSH
ncbi:MAG: hypothetical protein ABSH22_06890 [Tepidisphaeraceae bacterium]|jgi:hypothetical protein